MGALDRRIIDVVRSVGLSVIDIDMDVEDIDIDPKQVVVTKVITSEGVVVSYSQRNKFDYNIIGDIVVTSNKLSNHDTINRLVKLLKGRIFKDNDTTVRAAVEEWQDLASIKEEIKKAIESNMFYLEEAAFIRDEVFKLLSNRTFFTRRGNKG